VLLCQQCRRSSRAGAPCPLLCRGGALRLTIGPHSEPRGQWPFTGCGMMSPGPGRQPWGLLRAGGGGGGGSYAGDSGSPSRADAAPLPTPEHGRSVPPPRYDRLAEHSALPSRPVLRSRAEPRCGLPLLSSPVQPSPGASRSYGSRIQLPCPAEDPCGGMQVGAFDAADRPKTRPRPGPLWRGKRPLTSHTRPHGRRRSVLLRGVAAACAPLAPVHAPRSPATAPCISAASRCVRGDD
jgi:hypothetical protein